MTDRVDGSPLRLIRAEGALVQLSPPVSEVAWSPDFVAQTLEVLPLFLHQGTIGWIKPAHAESLRIGMPPSAKPGEVVLQVVAGYDATPIVVHSTSWRHEEGRVILTYVAAVEPPIGLPRDVAELVEVGHAELARGGATAPPAGIGVQQVIEHALRHLSWLVQDDEVVGRELASWSEVLRTYQPEPFRALG